MNNYIDGFVFPIPEKHLAEYKSIAEQVAEIWKEYGAIEYMEWVTDDLTLEGTRSFVEAADAKEDEVVKRIPPHSAGLFSLQKRFVIWLTSKFLKTHEWLLWLRH